MKINRTFTLLVFFLIIAHAHAENKILDILPAVKYQLITAPAKSDTTKLSSIYQRPELREVIVQYE